jgi:hypothetical protein
MAVRRLAPRIIRVAEIAVGYPHFVVAVVGGLLVLPFTGILLGLFSLLAVEQLVFAIPILLILFGVMMIALARAFIGISLRLLCSGSETGKPTFAQKGLEPKAADIGLWDRWID